jgi:hypothetical protein
MAEEDEGGSSKGGEVADKICAAIADEAVETALIYAGSAPVNEGQQVLCEAMMPDILESWDRIFEGKPPILISTMHPEAVGIIAMEISAMLTEAAIEAKEVRAAAEAAQQL